MNIVAGKPRQTKLKKHPPHANLQYRLIFLPSGESTCGFPCRSILDIFLPYRKQITPYIVITTAFTRYLNDITSPFAATVFSPKVEARPTTRSAKEQPTSKTRLAITLPYLNTLAQVGAFLFFPPSMTVTHEVINIALQLVPTKKFSAIKISVSQIGNRPAALSTSILRTT
jgi:hypothetical protein